MLSSAVCKCDLSTAAAVAHADMYHNVCFILLVATDW
jgi:hypothetical protein